MRNRICLHLAIVLAFASCSSKNNITQLWTFVQTNGNVRGDDTLLHGASFLQLRDDGSYTRDFGQFEYGTWEMDKGQFILRNQRGKTVHLAYEIKLNESKQKEMHVKIGNGATANFESSPLPDTLDNPFSKQLNRWRIPAVAKESDQQLHDRLYNHCVYWETYFKWAILNERKSIDVRSTPSLIKIYGNGFELKPYDKLPASWKSYFYDSADCQKASDIMKNVFDEHDINWGNSDNKFQMFIRAFNQLGRHLK